MQCLSATKGQVGPLWEAPLKQNGVIVRICAYEGDSRALVICQGINTSSCHIHSTEAQETVIAKVLELLKDSPSKWQEAVRVLAEVYFNVSGESYI